MYNDYVHCRKNEGKKTFNLFLIENFYWVFFEIYFSDITTHCFSMENVALVCLFFPNKKEFSWLIYRIRTAKTPWLFCVEKGRSGKRKNLDMLSSWVFFLGWLHLSFLGALSQCVEGFLTVSWWRLLIALFTNLFSWNELVFFPSHYP